MCLQKKKAAGLVEGMYTVRRLRDRQMSPRSCDSFVCSFNP